MLNNYFAKLWNLSQSPLSETFFDDIVSIDNDLLFCSTEEIESLLLNLDTSKATGPDIISARVLKGARTWILCGCKGMRRSGLRG